MVPVHSHLERRRKTAPGSGLIFLFAGILTAIVPNRTFAAEEQDLLLDQWLERQSRVQTWQADFVQTRKIPALVRPLVTEGKVFFRSPSMFHWRLGQPARTIAIRNAGNITIYYPLLERAEQYSVEGGSNDPWKDALAMLDAGFPQSREELERRFDLKSISIKNGIGTLFLQPNHYQTRKFLTRIELTFDPENPGLTAAEFEFGDGTLLRNEFTRAEINPPLEPALFELPEDTEIQISRPGQNE